MSLRDEILGKDDLPREEVKIPEWGLSDPVYVRTLTSLEMDQLTQKRLGRNGRSTSQNLDNFRAEMSVACLVDQSGDRVFASEDALALGGKSASAVGRIFEVAIRLNGLTKQDVEDVVKNSPDQSDVTLTV